MVLVADVDDAVVQVGGGAAHHEQRDDGLRALLRRGHQAGLLVLQVRLHPARPQALRYSGWRAVAVAEEEALCLLVAAPREHGAVQQQQAAGAGVVRVLQEGTVRNDFSLIIDARKRVGHTLPSTGTAS